MDHETYEEGAGFDTDYQVITKCKPTCAACAVIEERK